MTTLYSVSSGSYSDYGVGPLFRTREDAKKAAAASTYSVDYGSPFIEEFELYDNYEDYMSRNDDQKRTYKISAGIDKKDGTVNIWYLNILNLNIDDENPLLDRVIVCEDHYIFTTYLNQNRTTEELVENYFFGEKHSDTSNEANKQLIKIVADRFAKFRSEHEVYFM